MAISSIRNGSRPCSFSDFRRGGFSDQAWFLENTNGGRLALVHRMAGVKRFTELAAWQRASELQCLCIELLKRPDVQRNFKFRDQLSDAASSVPRNIAEGFGRFRPKENAQFVRVAKGSAHEILALLIEAQTNGYLAPEEFPAFERAARRTIGTLVGYICYLDSCDPKGIPPAK